MTNFSPQPDTYHPDDERDILSVYLDQMMTDMERTHLEERLQTDPDLRADLEELRDTIHLLRNLEPLVPPRSFALDSSIIAASRPFWERWQWAGGAVAALLLLVVVTTVYGLPVVNNAAMSPSSASRLQIETSASTDQDEFSVSHPAPAESPVEVAQAQLDDLPTATSVAVSHPPVDSGTGGAPPEAAAVGAGAVAPGEPNPAAPPQPSPAPSYPMSAGASGGAPPSDEYPDGMSAEAPEAPMAESVAGLPSATRTFAAAPSPSLAATLGHTVSPLAEQSRDVVAPKLADTPHQQQGAQASAPTGDVASADTNPGASSDDRATAQPQQRTTPSLPDLVMVLVFIVLASGLAFTLWFSRRQHRK